MIPTPAGLTFVLFADMGDIIPAIVGVLFLIVPVVGQLLANANKGNKPGRPAGGAQPKANPAVDKEVADFLRRVAQNKGNAPQGGGPQGGAAAPRANQPGQAAGGRAQRGPEQPRPGQARPAQAGRALPPRPGVRQPRRAGVTPGQPPVQAQVLPEKPSKPTEQSRDRLGTSERFNSASRLGSDVNAEVRKEEARRKRQFSRTVDTLEDHHLADSVAGEPRRTQRKTEMPVPAVDWAAMLGNADNVRQAIVFSEILQRPEHRWL